MDEFICNFCNSKFSNKSNLVTHQKKAKKCLIIQNKEINKENICEHCNKNFTSKQNLLKHICLNKTNSLLDEIQKLKEKLFKKDNENKLLNFTIKKQKEEIAYLKEQFNKSQNTVNKIAEIGAKKHTITANYKINQNILNQLAPYDVTPDKIDKIVQEKFTDGHLIQGKRGLVNIAEKNILTDEEGKKKLVCTDISRRIFIGKNENGKKFKVPDCVNFISNYIPSVQKKSAELITEYQENNPDELLILDELRKKFIDLQKIQENPSSITSDLAKVLYLNKNNN